MIGTIVTGHLNRPNTDFQGTVVEEYRVQVGPMTGAPMVKVALADGSHRYAFQASVSVVPDWPTTDQDTDVQSVSGDLGATVQEAFGHAWDCGRSYGTVRGVLGYIEATYDGGVAAFALDTVIL